MEYYCSLDASGRIKEMAVGFKATPLEGIIVDAPGFVVAAPNDWQYKEGKWIKLPSLYQGEPTINTELVLVYEAIAGLFEQIEALRAEIDLLKGV